ncbi:MAG TPA: glycosyl hydrolase family 8 [Polyangia bacterium]|nr:glycosyl hydrolase family 8 [Polyangia bacterium]
MLGSRPGTVALMAASLALASCTSTVDSVGYNGIGGIHLQPLKRLPSYPNPFKDLGKADTDVATKIDAAFTQLFHGDAGTQAIYFPVGTGQANIQDIYHNSEVRTEGIGLAMMICVELNKRMEFDALWSYALNVLQYKDGPRQGYFQSTCDTVMSSQICDDPYGEAQMVMALIFANDQWGSTTGTVDNANYAAGAVALLDVMRHKQDQNHGILGGVTNTFDTTSGLPFDVPVAWVADAQIGRPSIVMPAYYDLWAQATGDSFWKRAAAAGRDYWKKTAYPTTGLMPVRATFDGGMVTDWNTFAPESYRAQVNMALDEVWSGANPQNADWNVQEAIKLLKFFTSQNIALYGTSYTLDGTPINSMRENALVAANGISAMIATNIDRADYVEAVYDMAIPTGVPRYYAGILYLTALLILSGQYQVL